MPEAPKVVLTVAGFDPSSGAGITADLKTIAAHGLYGVSCITALTVQTTQGVSRFEALPPELIRETLDGLADDLRPAAVKIGMLGSGSVAAAVAEFLRTNPQPWVVLDPVLRSSSGTELLDQAGLRVLREELLELVDLLTPNLEEAGILTGSPVVDQESMQRACRALRELGAKNTVIKGGHLVDPVDLLAITAPDGSQVFYWYHNKKIATRSTHGTGCAYSSAIACNLALGRPLAGPEGAVSGARDYVAGALAGAYPIGKGTGPINHFHSLSLPKDM